MKKKKKEEVVCPPQAHELRFIGALDKLFRASNPVEVHQALEECLTSARTLTHVRALHSWATAEHNKSIVNFREEAASIVPKIVKRWKEMTLYVLSQLPTAKSPQLWGTLHGLCQTTNEKGKPIPLAEVIAEEWHNCSRSSGQRVKTLLSEFLKCDNYGSYPVAYSEVVSIAYPNRKKTPRKKTPEGSMAIG